MIGPTPGAPAALPPQGGAASGPAEPVPRRLLGRCVRGCLHLSDIGAPHPGPAFDDSRRLIGANRFYPLPAVVLAPLGPAAADGAAQGPLQDRGLLPAIGVLH